MRRLLIPFLTVALCCGLPGTMVVSGQNPPAPAQNPPAPGQDDASDPMVDLIYPNVPVTDILSFYETLTDKILIRDANMTGVNMSIIVNKKIRKSEAIRVIEATLLLNGYSLVPDSGNRVKVINSSAGGKNPRSEGVPLYANAAALPTGNEVVSYFMQLRFLASADALTIFQQHVVLHPGYGSIISVPNAQALVITENVSLIRQLINLVELIDVPPARVISEFITLKRADAERVAETITKMIDAEKSDKQKRDVAPGAPAASGQASAAGGSPPPAAGGAGNELFENDLVAGSAQLIPDARTNRILVITRPVNFPYIKNLIEEFDEVVGSSAPLERPLKYVSASEVLPVLADLLLENDGTGGAGGRQGQTGQTAPAPKNTSQSSQNNSSNNGSGLGGGSGVDSHPDILSEPEDTGPTSLIFLITHLIAYYKYNSMIVIGPPDRQEKVRSILNELDKRPPQVYLSTVIGQLTLTNNREFGIDYLKLFQSPGGTSGNNNGLAGAILNTATSLVNPSSLTTAAAVPASGGLALYGTIGKNLSVYVHALESTNRFKVLARPVVYTANNKKATISSGQKVPFPTSTLTNLNNSGGVLNNNNAAVAANIDYEDVVLKLEVIPLINADNEVNLKIAQVDDSIAGSQTISGNTVPTISTQQITTTVTVPNGNTVVLGGLITENTTNNLTGIPVLMHLPWVGPLFRDTKKNTERDELIIFIQPTVVQSNAEMLAASENEKNRAETGPAAYQFAQPVILL